MSELDRLIAELCPDGVDYVSLGEVCKKIYSGRNKLRSDSGQYSIYGSTGVIGYSDTFSYEQDAVLVARVGANCGYVHLATGCYDVSDNTLIIEPCEDLYDLKFAYYQLTNMNLNQYAKGGGQPLITAGQLKAFKILVPPLPIQREIVRILDNFTELTAELTARRKQYEHYRNELLTFDDHVPMVTLGDIATDMYRGSGIKRDEVTATGTPCVRYGEIYTTYNIWFDTCVSHTQTGSKTFGHGDILFAITGESVVEIAKSCVYMGHEKCFAGGDIVVMKHNQNPKYVSYALSTTNAQAQKSKGKVKSKVVHSSIPALKKIAIPIPSLEEQERIVAMLDRFDALTTNITSGLPSEIDARQKQYEYYRDKLLTFKEADA